MFIYLPYKHQKNRVYKCKISNYIDIDRLRNWVISQNPANDNSSHWWYSELPADVSLLYSKIARNQNIIDMFFKNTKYNIDIINDMNEIYVSPPHIPHNNTSDKIFYTKHIDGPYYLFPFASCYRVIVGLDDNSNVITCFNMIPEDTIVAKGDVVAFDFHREPHYIYNKIANVIDGHRVILKIHYCVYPWWAYYFGKVLSRLSIHYNRNFRNLFLFTLNPDNQDNPDNPGNTDNKYKKYIAYLMILSTQIFHDIEYYIGYNNISFACFIYYIGYITHYNVFLLGCLTIHYLRKTTAVPENCKHIALKRDIRFYYVIYSLQIYYVYYCYLLFLPNSYFTNSLFTIYILNDLKYLYDLC
jgi:hypothetical protein